MQQTTDEIVQNVNTNNQNNRNELDVNNSNETQRNTNHLSSLWNFMTKEDNEKVKFNIYNTVLSRQNGVGSGLRKRLLKVHKTDSFGMVSEHSRSKLCQISIEEKKKLDSLLLNCIIQDGRGFDDMRKSRILKIFTHLAPGKKNVECFITFINICI